MAGDVRGGRFVHGFTGEQFALPEAIESLRAMRKKTGICGGSGHQIVCQRSVESCRNYVAGAARAGGRRRIFWSSRTVRLSGRCLDEEARSGQPASRKSLASSIPTLRGMLSEQSTGDQRCTSAAGRFCVSNAMTSRGPLRCSTTNW